MPAVRIQLDIPEEHKLKVYQQLRDGSDPRGSFFLLVGVSTVIASLGLVTNSTAVVIGAMLVAPLMTPILGLALALVRGDASLISIALKSEVLGVAISIMVGALIGSALPVYLDPTPEMLSRTAPQLLDLLVAVFSGLAGAYALMDEKLSPALPGVAISTAIVPPLANCGLCLAMGAGQAAWGSFLLFFTNFLSILLVASLVFYLGGMAEKFQGRPGISMAKRFGVATAGFIVIALLLTNELIRMVGDARLYKEIDTALKSELLAHRVSDLAPLQISRSKDTVQVLAKVSAPSVMAPAQVRSIEDSLEATMGKQVSLHIRTTIAHDVSATGTLATGISPFPGGISSPAENGRSTSAVLQRAEQAIRERLEGKVGIYLDDLEAYQLSDYLLLVANIEGARNLDLEEVSQMKAYLDDIFPETPIDFLVRQDVSRLVGPSGRVRAEFTSPNISKASLDDETALGEEASSWLRDRGFSLAGMSVTVFNGPPHILLEVRGSRLFGDDDYRALSEALREVIGVQPRVYVKSDIESVQGPEGQIQMQDLLEDYRRRNDKAYTDKKQQWWE